MRPTVVCGALLVAGCFAPNLGDGALVCGGGGNCPPGYVCRADQHCWRTTLADGSGDLSAAADLSGAGDLGPGRDLALPPDLGIGPTTCTSAARVCQNASVSAACELFGGSYTEQPDRACPPTSGCSDGYCQPPSGALACTRPADCAPVPDTTCDPFVVVQGGKQTILGACVPPFGSSNGTCSATGFDSTCSSGFCISAGTKTVCLVLCAQASDCPTGETCAARLTTVEGLTTSVSVCGG